MSADNFRDVLNPLGPEYGATSRAARAAQRTERSMDDMLALAVQPDEQSRQAMAAQIIERRKLEQARAGTWRAIKFLIVTLLAAFAVFVWQLGDDHSALSAAVRGEQATPASHAPTIALAPVRAVRAPALRGSDARWDRDMRIPNVVDDADAVNNAGSDPR